MKKKKMTDRRFEELVREAKTLWTRSDGFRFRIVELCIEACDIHHGGSGDRTRFTVKRFAQAIGLERHTLYDWIRVKKRVVDKMPVNFQKKINEIPWDHLKRTADQIPEDARNKEVVRLFREVSNIDPTELKFIKYRKHIASIIYNLKNPMRLIDVKDQTIADIMNDAQIILTLANKEIEFRKQHGKSRMAGLVEREVTAKRKVKEAFNSAS